MPNPECRSRSSTSWIVHGAGSSSRRVHSVLPPVRAAGWLPSCHARAVGGPGPGSPSYLHCRTGTGQTGRMADQYVQNPVGTEPSKLPVLRWDEPPEGPVLVLLDQTRLPAEEVELVCTDVPVLVRAIQTLAVRGAPLLGI